MMRKETTMNANMEKNRERVQRKKEMCKLVNVGRGRGEKHPLKLISLSPKNMAERGRKKARLKVKGW